LPAVASVLQLDSAPSEITRAPVEPVVTAPEVR